MSNNLKAQKEEISPKEYPNFIGDSSDIDYYPWPQPDVPEIPIIRFEEKKAQDDNNNTINQINNLTPEKLNVDNFEVLSEVLGNHFNVSMESYISNLLGNVEIISDLS